MLCANSSRTSRISFITIKILYDYMCIDVQKKTLYKECDNMIKCYHNICLKDLYIYIYNNLQHIKRSEHREVKQPIYIYYYKTKYDVVYYIQWRIELVNEQLQEIISIPIIFLLLGLASLLQLLLSLSICLVFQK